MQFIKTIIWVILLVILIIFAVTNTDPVTVKLWYGQLWDTKLSFLVIASFALGFVPMWLIYRASRWRLKRRVANLESNLQQANDTIENLKHVPEPIMEDVPALPDAE